MPKTDKTSTNPIQYIFKHILITIRREKLEKARQGLLVLAMLMYYFLDTQRKKKAETIQ